ncbi:hypothetical protein C8J57DRAFT_1624556 [Mycena rebaudengoi]|nr:hypothetical protein C8J57DRAFT_1624556 [Mycena rebaudengoi]
MFDTCLASSKPALATHAPQVTRPAAGNISALWRCNDNWIASATSQGAGTLIYERRPWPDHPGSTYGRWSSSSVRWGSSRPKTRTALSPTPNQREVLCGRANSGDLVRVHSYRLPPLKTRNQHNSPAGWSLKDTVTRSLTAYAAICLIIANISDHKAPYVVWDFEKRNAETARTPLLGYRYPSQTGALRTPSTSGILCRNFGIHFDASQRHDGSSQRGFCVHHSDRRRSPKAQSEVRQHPRGEKSTVLVGWLTELNAIEALCANCSALVPKLFGTAHVVDLGESYLKSRIPEWYDEGRVTFYRRKGTGLRLERRDATKVDKKVPEHQVRADPSKTQTMNWEISSKAANFGAL